MLLKSFFLAALAVLLALSYVTAVLLPVDAVIWKVGDPVENFIPTLKQMIAVDQASVQPAVTERGVAVHPTVPEEVAQRFKEFLEANLRFGKPILYLRSTADRSQQKLKDACTISLTGGGPNRPTAITGLHFNIFYQVTCALSEVSTYRAGNVSELTEAETNDELRKVYIWTIQQPSASQHPHLTSLKQRGLLHIGSFYAFRFDLMCVRCARCSRALPPTYSPLSLLLLRTLLDTPLPLAANPCNLSSFADLARYNSNFLHPHRSRS
ncbi:uncharacterized protein SRS1_20016 [Sporisorium reilianum f. sp. reilianum]|uniref:Uncharacterized protein n=1 Tax=Sporisorium reilianum f. sp. reilianum TaxID=72559 RepID=A0A2N8ULK7_9BASI|nr:uncharacterized protein SRS1_20016 [Sporisorium reilianum f. sp. reilianum]